jgi:drug/metabolite transporter (DMT)-like permease
VNSQISLDKKAIALQVGLCALWALGQIAIKSVSDQISPLFHAGVRSLGASCVLLLWMNWRGIKVWQNDSTLGLGILVGVLFGLEFLFLFQGFMLTTAARGTLMLYTASFFVAIGSHFFIPNQRLSARRVLGLACAFAGVTLAFSDKLFSTVPGQTETIQGDALCLIAASFWGATTVIVKATKLRSLQPERNIFYQLAVSVPVLLIGAALMQEKGITQPTPYLWAVLFFGIFIIASASYLAWFWLISHYDATTLHAFTFLTPLFGILLSAILLGEVITTALVMATVLVAAGIYLVNRGK